jgi:hypothetical protein
VYKKFCNIDNRKAGSALVGGGSGGDLKLGAKHLIRRIDVVDRKDTEDVKHAFEVIPRDQVSVSNLPVRPFIFK